MIPCAPRPWQQGGQPVTPPHRTGTGLVLPRSTLRLQRKPSPAPPAPPCPGDGGNRGNRRLQPCRGGHGAGHGAGRGQGEVPHMWQGGPWGGPCYTTGTRRCSAPPQLTEKRGQRRAPCRDRTQSLESSWPSSAQQGAGTAGTGTGTRPGLCQQHRAAPQAGGSPAGSSRT